MHTHIHNTHTCTHTRTHTRMHTRTHTHMHTHTNKKKNEWDAGLMHHCRGMPRLNGEVPGSTQGTSNLHSRCRPDLLIHHGHSQSMDHRYLKESHISTLCPALDTSSKQTNKNAHDIYTAIPDLFQKTKNNILPNVTKVRHVDDVRQRDLLRWVFCVPPAQPPPPSSVQPTEPPQSSAGSHPAPGAGTCSQSNTITITCAAQQLNT